MKKAFAIFTAVILMPASQSLAWTGGPFSNNSRFASGDDGVYEAVATTSNGLGIYRFAVRNNGSSSEAAGGGGTNPNGSTGVSSNVQFSAGLLAASSSNVWYYKGITYYGPAFGTVNSDAGIVVCIGNAESNQPSVGGLQGQSGAAPLPAQNGTGGINGVVIRGPQGGNIGYANSSFTAKIKKKDSPTVRFNGTGVVSFVGEANIVAEVEAINPVIITAGGVIGAQTNTAVGTAPGGTNTATGVSTGSVTTTPGGGTSSVNASFTNTTNSFSSNTLVSTGGEDSDFSQRGHVRKFVVFGSRVSTTVTP